MRIIMLHQTEQIKCALNPWLQSYLLPDTKALKSLSQDALTAFTE